MFKVTVGAFVLAGILYGFGSWLECIRMFGSGSAAYGQGWEMDAIAACVVGGISFDILVLLIGKWILVVKRFGIRTISTCAYALRRHKVCYLVTI